MIMILLSFIRTGIYFIRQDECKTAIFGSLLIPEFRLNKLLLLDDLSAKLVSHFE